MTLDECIDFCGCLYVAEQLHRQGYDLSIVPTAQRLFDLDAAQRAACAEEIRRCYQRVPGPDREPPNDVQGYLIVSLIGYHFAWKVYREGAKYEQFRKNLASGMLCTCRQLLARAAPGV